MEHYGTFNVYGNNSYIVNDPNAIAYHFQEQPDLTMPMSMTMPDIDMNGRNNDIDMNGHNNYTAMLLRNSPTRIHQDMYSYQPSYARNPTNDLITHYYNEQWLTLSPPEPGIETSPLTQIIPMERSEFDMNHFDNNHLFLNSNMDEMILNPMGMNVAPPTLEIQFGGRLIPARPIELHQVGGFEPIMVHEPQMSGQTVLHAVRDSNSSILIDLTDKDLPPITSNNYTNHTVEYQEWDNQNFLPIPLDNNINHTAERQELDIQCDCQFCRTHRQMSPNNEDDESMDYVDEADNNNNENNIIVIDDDTEDDDNEDVDNNDDDDDDNDMNTESRYETYVPSVVTQGYRVADTLAEFDHLSYEQILALQEEIGFVDNGVPQNMLERALKKNKFLPTASSSSSNASCTVCLDEFKAGQDLGVLKCGHEFCYACIKKWLMNKKTCPLCRESVL